MRKKLTILVFALIMATQLQAQIEPSAGNWKTWFITSGREYRLPPPPSHKEEIAEVISAQKAIDSAGWQQMLHWSAGAPGYRWQDIMSKLWMMDTAAHGPLANMLLGTAIYDATVAAWDTKYAYKRVRPYDADGRIEQYGPKSDSPSYPCEHSVAAGVAATIIGHFYPAMAESVNKKAKEVMTSRIAAGAAFPSDTRAGFELGKKIALKEIENTKGFVPNIKWDRNMPKGPGVWTGKHPMFPLAGRNKTVILKSASQFRPGPPPDFAKDMEELRNFKPTFRSTANAFHFAASNEDVLSKKMFEYNLHLNPPRAARLYAINAVATYDGFAACWDAKYTYWGIRPDQYDTTYRPVLMHTPPFPGYPSGHAMIGAVHAEIYSYFFPADKEYFQKRAKDGAESRFQGGIHFRTDNEVGRSMGKKVGSAIIEEIKTHGVNDQMGVTKTKGKSGQVKTAKNGD